MVNQIINKLKFFLKKDTFIIKTLSFSYLLFIIFNRIRLGSDQLVQLGSAVNFLNGGEFTLSIFDGEEVFLSTVDDWPLFYRVFSIPFLMLFKDLEFIYLSILVSSYILLLLSINEIINRVFLNKNNKTAALNLIFISTAFCLSPFRFGSEIDVFSMSFIFFLLVKVYDYFNEGNKAIDLLMIFFFFFLLVNSRYAYILFILLFLAFLLILDLIQKSFIKNLILKTSGVFLIILNIFYLTQTHYFQKTSSMISEASNVGKTAWSYFYSFGFNSLFPDYILLNFAVKVLNFNLSSNYLLFAMPVFFISIALLVLLLNTTLKRLKQNITSKFVTLEVLLLVAGLLNLINLLYIFGVFTSYKEEQIASISSIVYAGLSVNNRYLILTFASFFLLIVCYSIFYKKIYQLLILMSILVGVSHNFYLGFKYSFSRSKNMNFVNYPIGSYNDCLEINKIISKENNSLQNQLFVVCYRNDSANFRQITPRKLVVASGITILNNINSVKHYNFKVKEFEGFEKIYYCDYKKNNNHVFKNKIYEGNIYNLYTN